MMISQPKQEWTTVEALIIGRAYPERSRRHIETVCTGAITEKGQLIRLYPVPFRYLNEDSRYKLWSWVRMDIKKSTDDHRVESFRVREDSIKVISRVGTQSEQYELIKKAIGGHRERLESEYRSSWRSMGIIEIKPNSVHVEKSKFKSMPTQQRLDVKVLPLEEFPIRLRLDYQCSENPECPGHFSHLIAWEYAETYRKFRGLYGEADALKKIQSRLLDQLNKAGHKPYALLSTHSRHPVWMVGQLYSFPAQPSQLLF